MDTFLSHRCLITLVLNAYIYEVKVNICEQFSLGYHRLLLEYDYYSNYKSAREKALSNNHIPEEVYDNLVKTVHKYLPLLHRYTQSFFTSRFIVMCTRVKYIFLHFTC
jgi:hypothetical protein